MPASRFQRILVAIETDATRFHGEHAARPRLPDKTGAEQVLSHLSTDLADGFRGIRSCALCMAAVLYDQTELLQPGYPVFATLEQMLSASFEKQDFQPRLLSIGADAGRLPRPELQPSTQLPLGALLTLPLVLAGAPGLLAALGDEMESRFIESGQLSAHSAKALEAQFGIEVRHARFMTVTDISAMLRLQLEHFGYLALWELLDAAINGLDGGLSVEGRGGQTFRWDGSSVVSRFMSFDEWARSEHGRPVPAGDQALAGAYADWTREYRQYLTTLQAHGVPVRQELAGSMGRSDDGSFAVEHCAWAGRDSVARITEHSAGELGTVAVSVVRDGQQFNYYPLVPSGLNRLHAEIRSEAGEAPSVAFPGCILYDPGRRCLRPESLHGDG